MQKKGIWLFAAIFVLIGALGISTRQGVSVVPGGLVPSATDGAIHVSIANSSAKETWLHQAVEAFNTASRGDGRLQADGKRIVVEVIPEMIDGKKSDYRSGTMVTDTLEGRINPTVLSPADETWIAKLNKEWQALRGAPATTGQAPVLARTPLVITMWQSRARSLGCWPTVQEECTWETIQTLASNPSGWAMVGQPAWRKFKFGYGYVGESNSGTLSAVLMCTLGVGKTGGLVLEDVDASNGCGQTISAFESAKVHSGTKSDWLLGQMLNGGPEYLDAIITNETEVIAFNRQNGPRLREPLVSVYPRDGTILFGHPYAILDGAPWVTSEQATAARVFRDFLLTQSQQEALVGLGLRPGDSSIKVGSPIEPAYGANPDAALVAIDLPEPLVIDRVIELWHQVKKPAAIAVVFDKSGSMAGGKLTAAITGAKAFIDRMDRVDWLFWVPFDERVYPSTQGPKSQIGERLIQDISGTAAGGGTALYDAILAADDTLQSLRRQQGDRYRYGIVVLSDGHDGSSKSSLVQIEARFRSTEQDPTGVQVHTIAIGTDANTAVLTKLANGAHGKFWKGNTEKEMIDIYQSIAAYY